MTSSLLKGRHDVSGLVPLSNEPSPQEVLERRLLARRREDSTSVRQRLVRSAAQPGGPKVTTIVNDGPLMAAVEAFRAELQAPAEVPIHPRVFREAA